jgi:hypothetical protein
MLKDEVNPETEMTGLIDSLGARAAEFEKAKKLVREFQNDQTRLRALIDEKNKPDETGSAVGSNFIVDFGAKGKERKIVDMKPIVERLGAKVFLTVCSFPLGQVDDLFTKAERDKFVTESQNGSRSLEFKPARVSLAEAAE